MIMNFDKELEELTSILGIELTNAQSLRVSIVFVKAFEKGMSFERKRILDIIARKAINASDLRNAIHRPVR